MNFNVELLKEYESGRNRATKLEEENKKLTELVSDQRLIIELLQIRLEKIRTPGVLNPNLKKVLVREK